MNINSETSISTDENICDCTCINNCDEDFCINVIGSYARPTSHIYNQPHERAKARLAGDVLPILIDRQSFTTAGMDHAIHIRSLTQAELMQPLNDVEKELEESDRAYQMKLANGQIVDTLNDHEFADLDDQHDLFWFETAVLDDIRVMQSCFLNADLMILRRKLGERWDEFQQRKG